MSELSMKERQLALTKKLKEITVKKISDKLIEIQAKNGAIVEISLDYDFNEYGIKPGDYIMPPAKYKRTGLGICVGINKSWLWFLHEGNNSGISFWNSNSKARFEEDGFTFISSEI